MVEDDWALGGICSVFSRIDQSLVVGVNVGSRNAVGVDSPVLLKVDVHSATRS